MTKPIQSKSPCSFTHLFQIARPLAVSAIQIAIQTIFIGGAILIAASTIPIRFHGVLIPVVALSATLLAAYLYSDRLSLPEPKFKLFSLPLPIPEQPVEAPAAAAAAAPQPL